MDENTLIMPLLLFIVVVVVIIVAFAIAISSCTYPSQHSIYRLFKVKKVASRKFIQQHQDMSSFPYHDDVWLFYALRAMAYRDLSNMHMTIHYAIKIIGVLSTIITAFFSLALSSHWLIIFFALLAALSSILGVFLPCGKMITLFNECATEMCHVVFIANPKSKKMQKTYLKCEKIIKHHRNTSGD